MVLEYALLSFFFNCNSARGTGTSEEPDGVMKGSINNRLTAWYNPGIRQVKHNWHCLCTHATGVSTYVSAEVLLERTNPISQVTHFITALELQKHERVLLFHA